MSKEEALSAIKLPGLFSFRQVLRVDIDTQNVQMKMKLEQSTYCRHVVSEKLQPFQDLAGRDVGQTCHGPGDYQARGRYNRRQGSQKRKNFRYHKITPLQSRVNFEA